MFNNMHPAAPPHPLARWVAYALAGIARHGHLRRVAGPLLILVWQMLRTAEREALGILDRLAAGTLQRHFGRRPPRPAAAPRRAPQRRVPAGSAWLLRLIPEAAPHAAQLEALLRDAELSAKLTEAPQLRRALRPVCRMLGMRPPQPNPPPVELPAASPSPARPPALRIPAASCIGPARPWPRALAPQRPFLA